MSVDHTTRPNPALSGTWRLEPAGSTVEFTGRHFFFLPVRGSVPVRSGRAELGPDGVLLRLDAAAGAAGFESGNPQRDTAVRGPRFLDAERFPELRLTGERLLDEDGLGLAGLLEVKGRATPVTFTVDELTVRGERAVVRAAALVDRHACGVGGMRGLVGAELRVRVRAEFVREG
ncbi:YceI family protein [Streptomyces africanus]|uniref:YceI family protein n=1 Tax=Streptomyces africanus TaxID=231024 RepID=UPI000A38385D|nr:YceI family protein [Streptomyces africanus]